MRGLSGDGSKLERSESGKTVARFDKPVSDPGAKRASKFDAGIGEIITR